LCNTLTGQPSSIRGCRCLATGRNLPRNRGVGGISTIILTQFCEQPLSALLVVIPPVAILFDGARASFFCRIANAINHMRDM
jgi:hypothetical protein